MFCFYTCLSLTVSLTLAGHVEHYDPEHPYGKILGEYDFPNHIEAKLAELAKKPWVEINEERPNIYVNNPHCGRSIVPKEQYYDFKPKCFKNSYPDKTYEVYENYHSREGWERDSGVQSRILWGTDAQVGEAPWAVFITNYKWRNKWKFWSSFSFCSATLITLEWVMTAAHCIDKTKYTYVHAGDVLYESGPKRWANKIFFHPEYDGVTYQYDVALIKLNLAYSRTQSYGRYIINPVCLPKWKNATFNYQKRNWVEGKYLDAGNIKSENATLYGFGVMNGHNPDQLQRADITMLRNRECPINTLCAEYHRRDPRPCGGDSGGGLVQRLLPIKATVLIGVQSTVHKAGGDQTGVIDCIPPNVPISSTFTNVPRMMDWVMKTITDN